jgi:peptidoglycan hydrolase-like protein with peptidoglycan-binding domain
VTALEVPTSVNNDIMHAPFIATIKRGSRGPQVTLLQQFLALDPAIYPEGAVSGYFGPATQGAVQRFQEKYGIAHKGDSGYGQVGPRTRAVLNIARTP